MKLARYEYHGFSQLGVVRHDAIHLLDTALGALEVLSLPLDERNLLEAQAGRRQRIPVEDVRLLPPVEPRGMRDFVTFEAHIAGMKKSEAGDGSVPAEWYEAPAFLFMNPWSVVGAYDDVALPSDTEAFDFELEVAAVVGCRTQDVTVEAARSHIVGYTIMNDWSARDVQGREMRVGLGPSKGKDFATTLGPWITSSDELEPYRRDDGMLALDMTVEVNGAAVGQDTTEHMGWSFEQMLAHAARGAVVGPGDVLASGTCSSGALAETWSRSGRQEPPPLGEGDVVTMTVEALGSISNRVGPRAHSAGPVGRARDVRSHQRAHQGVPR